MTLKINLHTQGSFKTIFTSEVSQMYYNSLNNLRLPTNYSNTKILTLKIKDYQIKLEIYVIHMKVG